MRKSIYAIATSVFHKNNVLVARSNILSAKHSAIIQSLFAVLIACLSFVKVSAQSNDSCNKFVSSYYNHVTLQSISGSYLDSIESGRDFNLNVTLPGGGSCADGYYVITVTTSANIVYACIDKDVYYYDRGFNGKRTSN